MPDGNAALPAPAYGLFSGPIHLIFKKQDSATDERAAAS
jgi:hypothetical protein